MSETALRLFHTVRHLKASQVGARLARAPKRVLLRRWGPSYLRWLRRAKDPPRASDLPRLVGRDLVARGAADGPELEAALTRAEHLLQRRFRFHHHGEAWCDPIDWHRPEGNLLWRYTLNGFVVGLDLGLLYLRTGRDEAYRGFRELATSWIDRNPCGRTVGWDPYPTSRRIVHWILAGRLFGETLWEDARFAGRFLASLSDQVLFLERNLERHLGGNHLWENFWALTLAGLFFEGADGARWLERGRRGLWEQVREQVLDDGGHYERSPHYHVLMARSLVEAGTALRQSGAGLPADVEERLRRMMGFLSRILHPDGRIPLLNDSVLGEVEPASVLHHGAVFLADPTLKGRAESFGLWPELWMGEEGHRRFEEWPVQERSHRAACPATGLFVLGGRVGDRMIVDAGPVGPDFLPGHGHADTLSFELSCGMRRFVVDSGVGEYYGDKAWRDYERGTRAHNTVEIDGENQSDVWGQFRVGRRARPRDVRWRDEQSLAILRASHDGYGRLPGRPRHTRTVIETDGGFWLVVDEIRGAGFHRCVSRLHLHPECRVEGAEDLGLRISRADASIGVRWAPGVKLALRRGEREPLQGWYAPEFGLRIPGVVVEATAEGRLPLVMAFVIGPAGTEREPLEAREEGRGVQVVVGPDGGRRTFRLTEDEVVVEAQAYHLNLQSVTHDS